MHAYMHGRPCLRLQDMHDLQQATIDLQQEVVVVPEWARPALTEAAESVAGPAAARRSTRAAMGQSFRLDAVCHVHARCAGAWVGIAAALHLHQHPSL